MPKHSLRKVTTTARPVQIAVISFRGITPFPGLDREQGLTIIGRIWSPTTILSWMLLVALGASGSDADNSESTLNGAYLNQLYWFSFSGSNFNVYGCGSNCNYGHSLYWCTGTCTSVHDHTYGDGSWLNDPGNETANPMFVNYISAGNPSNDYHLEASSPAIAAGTYLTTVASGDKGSGTSLVVTDTSYFQDGYSLSNANSTVHGDCIAVNTASNHVCVTAVNYTTNTLTHRPSSITRSSGQGIYLYSKSDGVQVLTGATPDMGAFP